MVLKEERIQLCCCLIVPYAQRGRLLVKQKGTTVPYLGVTLLRGLVYLYDALKFLVEADDSASNRRGFRCLAAQKLFFA